MNEWSPCPVCSRHEDKARRPGAVAETTEILAVAAGADPEEIASPGRRSVLRRRTGQRTLAVALVLVGLGVGAVVADALSAPGSDSAAAKLAEWGRDHGLGAAVTWLEAVGYERNTPVVGGSPPGGIPTPAGTLADPAGGRGVGSAGDGSSLPPIAPVAAGPGLPGEGQWHTVVMSGGRPAIQVASLRPDARHTSFVAGVMRMDPALVRGQLHPGTRDPGGSWQSPTELSDADFADIAAVFNGGFRLNDPSHNGYFAEGRTVRPLVGGKASLVLYRDGHADVGAWNREVGMTGDVASVRQNLLPLVDGAQVNPTCATGGAKEWGSTVGQAAFIHRSGFGVTADGMEIYVGGPSLSVCTLGRILVGAGVVRGMELDINPNWVSGAYFHDSPDGPPSGFRLFPGERVAAAHYLTASSRDWFSWSLRSPASAQDTASIARQPAVGAKTGARHTTRHPGSPAGMRTHRHR